ncbi:MAG: terminase small subunit, partial [Spirochaetaceae bacterium]|nr:terminase small subunit [Spirochaetaceae bacterium]
MWDEGLKAREREFVLAFCTDDACFWNGTKAAMKVTGQDETSAAVTANRLLKKPNVKK